MTTHARLAGLIRRFNRKTLALALGALIALAVVAHGIGAAAYSPTQSGPAQTQTIGGSSGSGDAGTAAGAGDSASQSTYMPSVDDLTGNTVVYDDGTGDQMDYVPPFDPGS
jgi:hypothetical protein